MGKAETPKHRNTETPCKIIYESHSIHPHRPHVEIKVEVTARFRNGIDCDPRVLERQPTLPEIFDAAAKIVPGHRSDYHPTSTLED